MRIKRINIIRSVMSESKNKSSNKVCLQKAVLIAASVFSFISFACKDEFDPKGEMKDKFILSCIVRGETDTQTAYLTRTYNVEGYNPYTNSIDPAIKNAEIRVWQLDSVYLFKNSAFQRTDSLRYGSWGSQYTSSFNAAPGANLAIEALLADGRRLHGYTTVPQMIYRDYHDTDTLIPPVGKKTVRVAWTTKNDGIYYFPMIRILYYKNINGSDVLFEKPVPIGYNSVNGKSIPLYPPAGPFNFYVYDMSTIDAAMREISAGDPVKENYKIISLMVAVYALDRNLSAFYSAGKLVSDGYSITVDQTDYSNIEGGLGIFGSYIKREFGILFERKYVYSLGYQPALP